MTIVLPEADVLGLALGVAALGGAGVWMLGRTTPEPLISREVRFGAGLAQAEVCAVVDAVAGYARGSEVRAVVAASAGEICHVISGRSGVIEGLGRTLAGVAPNVRLEKLDADRGLTLSDEAVGASLSWNGAPLLLKASDVDLGSAGVLGAVSELRQGERLWLQLVLAPGGRIGRPVIEGRGAARPGGLSRVVFGAPVAVAREQAGAVLTKASSPLVTVRMTVAAMRSIQRGPGSWSAAWRPQCGLGPGSVVGCGCGRWEGRGWLARGSEVRRAALC